MKNNEQGNSNPEAVEDAVFGSNSNDYFDALDKEVNGVIRDESQEESKEQVTQEQNVPDPEPVANNDEATDWKKRYSDSSAEAQRLAAENKELSVLKPLINVMKTDSGLVDTIRDYLSTGGKAPKSIKEELQLDEDFVYDAHEAVTSPESKSAQVFNTMVDKAVSKKVSDTMGREKAVMNQHSEKLRKQQEIEDFKKRNNMSDADFNVMMDKAKNTKFTLDDMHYLMNKGKAEKNVADSTKQDMLSQMKTMRDIPASQAGTNSAPHSEKGPEDEVFDTILGLDNEFDKLFG